MRTPRALASLLLLGILLAGCEEQSELIALRPLPQPISPPSSPWDTMPPERLYGAPARENVRLQPVELDILDLPKGWDGMRFAVIADLHLSLWADNRNVAAESIRQALAARPDAVVLLGDYITQEADTLLLREVLAPLQGQKTIAVLGEGDIGSDSLEASISRTLRGAGVQLLKNSMVAMERQGDTAFIAGLDPDLANKGWNEREWILATLGQGMRIPLLLTHLPALTPTLPPDRYPAVIGGNTFCGRLEVPRAHRRSFLETQVIPGGVIPGAERLYRVKGNLMFVTCGIGYSFIPIRFGYPPEVALVKLIRYDPAAPAAGTDSLSAGVDTLLQRYQQGMDSVQADTTR